MKKWMKSLFLPVLIGFLLLLSACGGGGGSGESSGSSGVEAVIDALHAVNKQSEVILDGSKSVNAKIFEWKVLEGPAYKIEDSDKSIAKFIPISEGTYKIQLKVSDGETEDTATIEIKSKPISSIVITSPTLDESYVTTNNIISLKGNISGHIISVKAVNVSTNKEYQAVLDNGSFTVENIHLQQGDNLIKAIGVDSIGKEFQDTLTVTYNPDIKFLSNLALTPDVAFVNETTSITARVAIAQSANISGVKLFKVDKNNNPTEEIADLYDDGNVNNGDDIAGDGVYSAKFTVNTSEEGIIKYRVVVNNENYSDVASLTVTSHITDEQITTAKQVIANALNKLPETAVSEDKVNQSIDNLIYTLKNDPNVLKIKISPNESYIEIVTKDGIHEAIGFSYKDNETGAQTKGGSRYSPPVPNDFRKTSLRHYTKSKAFITKALNNNENETYTGSYNVIYLEPYAFQFGTFNRDIFKDYPEFTITYLENYDATVETFKNLDKYGIIIINSHGGWGSVFLTGQKVTNTLLKQYEEDIKKDRLQIYKHVVLVKDAGGFWIFKWDKEEKADVFEITYKFITYYYQNKKLPDSLVYLGMCEGLEEKYLANAFISAGAKTVVGYTDTVWSGYDNGIFDAFFNSLLSGKTVEKAVNDARNTMGKDDEVWYQNTYGKKAKEYTPAKFDFRGKGKLKLFKEDISNGSFENNLKYWKGEGDVRVISVLGPLAPQDGSYMAIISTGLGSINDSNSYVLQKFKVPLDANTLSFMYDVVSEEPMEYVGTEYDDKFQASIIDEEGNEKVIGKETVNTSQWNKISGIDFYGGDDTTYHTGWKSVNFDISKYRGKTITIKFHVWDKGDSLYDTAALIDKVEVQ